MSLTAQGYYYAFCTRLQELINDQAAWSQETFGTDEVRGPIGPLLHLSKEAMEAAAKPSDIKEYADCFLLFLDAKRRGKIDWPALLDACAAKMVENKARKWPEKTSDAPVFHVDEEKQAVATLTVEFLKELSQKFVTDGCNDYYWPAGLPLDLRRKLSACDDAEYAERMATHDTANNMVVVENLIKLIKQQAGL